MPVLLLAILIFYIVLPFYQVYYFVRPPRFPLNSSLQDYDWQGREVKFGSSDGLILSGWYIPPQNRAAVILVHGYGGNQQAMAHHAKTLTMNGYGVLL